jgi:hypothetical protein
MHVHWLHSLLNFGCIEYHMNCVHFISNSFAAAADRDKNLEVLLFSSPFIPYSAQIHNHDQHGW